MSMTLNAQQDREKEKEQSMPSNDATDSSKDNKVTMYTLQ